MALDTAIPGKKPERSNSRKRVRRPGAQPLTQAKGEQRRAQIEAYYDLKKNSPALKAARLNRIKRMQQANWLQSQAQIPVHWRAIMVMLRVIIMTLVMFVLFRIMMQEKQLLRIRHSLTMQARDTMFQSRMSWSSFSHAYESRYRRSPPEDYKRWLNFAQDQMCEPFKMYNAIERDLMPFRRQLLLKNSRADEESQPKLNWKDYQNIATNYTAGAYLLVEIKDKKMTIVDKQLDEWFDQHPTSDGTGWRGYREELKLQWNLEWLLDPILQHEPPITTRFVINLHHEPKSPPNASVPIFSSHHLSFHTDRDDSHPGDITLEIANKNRNGIIDPRDETTRDLLMPHLYIAGGRMGAAGMTSSPAIGGFWFWPFYRQGRAWTKRKNAIVWRGSTLGNYQKNATGGNFFTGPRFTTMKLWAGKAIHPLDDKIPIDVDFAFTRLIIQGEGRMDRNQKDAIRNAAKKEYRFARPMAYGRLQKYKYLLDIDGNGFSVRFPPLLRSGSLIFKSTRYREWYSERLRSWKDYIPVNYDTSDLGDKLEWVSKQDPDVITRIVQHGKDTAQRHIRPEDMQCYMYRLILEYATLFDPQSIG